MSADDQAHVMMRVEHARYCFGILFQRGFGGEESLWIIRDAAPLAVDMLGRAEIVPTWRQVRDFFKKRGAVVRKLDA